MTYNQALSEAKGNIGHCSDAAEMAAFCDGPLQTLVGAVSPKLVWEGAQKSGVTTRELAALCRNALAVSDLQWL